MTVTTTYKFTCLILYYILVLFVFPILYVPGHAAPGADGIASQVCVEAITILPEEHVVLDGVLLNQFAQIAIRRTANRLIKGAASLLNVSLGARIGYVACKDPCIRDDDVGFERSYVFFNSNFVNNSSIDHRQHSFCRHNLLRFYFKQIM